MHFTLQCASLCRVQLRGVHPTAESTAPNYSKNFTVCITSRSWAPHCASHRGVKLRGVYHTAESNCTPRSQTAHRGVKLHTGESNCTLRSQNQNLCESLVGLKGTVGRNPFRGEHILHERKDLKKFFWLAMTKILTPPCDAHRGVKFFNLCDLISHRYWNWIRKYLTH